MSMLQQCYEDRCWSCDRLQWICTADHLLMPMVKGAIQGFLIGGAIGAAIAIAENLLRAAL